MKSGVFTGLTAGATWLLLAVLALIIAGGIWAGGPHLSWRLVSEPASGDMFDPAKAGLLSMILGTVSRVFLMTLFVMPAGVITAIYLGEYAPPKAWTTRFMRAAITNLAGVPSIVFGLFGLGFFVGFLGGGIDGLAGSGGIKWGRPALVWASLTLALMTLPVVIVATEESLRAIPSGIREAALALGATRLQTIVRVVLPQAVPGILTGGILAIGRAAGEVAPILFTGAAFLTDGRIGLADRFMDLAYHVFVLSTQSPDLERSRPLLHASVLVLLVLTVLLNLLAVLVRARIRAAAPARS